MAAEAGRRTADYLLAHRIPRWAQAALRHLPAAMASRVLLAAISRHAWTFVGSGHLVVRNGRPLRIDVVGGPVATAGPASATLGRYYAATFERLYRTLVSPRARAADAIASVDGIAACRLRLEWR